MTKVTKRVKTTMVKKRVQKIVYPKRRNLRISQIYRTINGRKRETFSLRLKKYKMSKGCSSLTVCDKIPKEIRVNNTTFEELWNLHPSKRDKCVMFGKDIVTPRWCQSYGRNYHFTGKQHVALSTNTHPYIEKLSRWLKKYMGNQHNQILFNWYANGHDYIGFHADDEKDIVEKSTICSFSFGQERDFFVLAKDRSEKCVIKVKNNSFLSMDGDIQTFYKHSIPKRALSTCPGRRINITFRLLK